MNFFLTIRTYGTWLHGDERGSVDAEHNQVGSPLIPSNPRWHGYRASLMKTPAVVLDEAALRCVEGAIDDVATYRGWTLHARHARSNHVHIAVSSVDSPDKMSMNFKAYATRDLRRNQHFAAKADIWAEGASKRFFNSEEELMRIDNYIVFEQDKQKPEASTR
jgi:REP element-mobilizing transposase RayT